MAVQLKSDLTIPEHSSKFITLYLLFSIGFRGGQELAHSSMDAEMIGTLVAGILASALVPLYTFYLLKRKLGVENAGAIAASYGSVSAVTFITAVAFLGSTPIGGPITGLVADYVSVPWSLAYGGIITLLAAAYMFGWIWVKDIEHA